MEHNINILKNSALQYGLEISEEKSKVLQVRGRDRPEKERNYEVVKEVKYLGVKVGGRGRNIYQMEKEDVIQKAQIKVAQIKSYVRKSYDKTSVGKATWKLQMMPSIMYGKQVITLPKCVIKKLQTIENGVYRYLIGVAAYGPVAALREVGASRVETRVMETILMFALDTLNGNFEKVKEYMNHEKETGKGSWIKTAISYMLEIGVKWEKMLEMDRRALKMKIREWDNQKWIE